MTEKQTYYETMYILRPDIPEDEVDNHMKTYTDIIAKENAKVLDSQMRGKRRLAYTISKHKEGIYVQLSHNGDGQHVATLERAMRLSEDVIRYLTVIQEGTPPVPRVVTPSKEKDKSITEEKKEITSEEKNTEKSEKDEAKTNKKDESSSSINEATTETSAAN